VRKKWLILALCATLAVVVFLVWSAAEDARQAALLDARVRQAEDRVTQAHDRFGRLYQDKAPAEEVHQAEREWVWAEHELVHLRIERKQRQQEASWHARLLREVRRRAGW
jgi:hypothetical protein